MTTLSLDIDLDREQARNAIGALSTALGFAAVLAPGRTAALFGVPATGSGPLLVRMIGVRNATMGLRTLQATGEDQARAISAGLVVGAVDALAILGAARRGVLSRKAAGGVLAVLAGIAAAGFVASQP